MNVRIFICTRLLSAVRERALLRTTLILHWLRFLLGSRANLYFVRYFPGVTKLVSCLSDEEAKKGPKRRGAPRSAGRAAANIGPVNEKLW